MRYLFDAIHSITVGSGGGGWGIDTWTLLSTFPFLNRIYKYIEVISPKNEDLGSGLPSLKISPKPLSKIGRYEVKKSAELV